jgi:hypothetical protein
MLALAAAGVLAASACSNFQDVSTVSDLRVLSIATEPSEIILSTSVDLSASPPMATVDPATDLPIAVQPLLPDPIPGRTVTWTLQACPNDPFGAAPPAGGAGNMLGGARSTVGGSPCPSNPALTWSLVSDPAPAGEARTVQITADQLLTAFTHDVYPSQTGKLHGGFDLGEPITLQLTATDGVDTAVALKRVLFWANRISDDQTANVTPVIPSVTMYAERDPATFEPVGTPAELADGTPAVVSVDRHLWIQPQLAPGTAEPYVTTVIDPATDTAIPDHVDRERIRYAFYATAGTFTPPRTVNELPFGFVAVGPNPIHLESEYAPPGSLDGLPLDGNGCGQVTVWIVVRDDRGGESWVTRQLLIAPPGGGC